MQGAIAGISLEQEQHLLADREDRLAVNGRLLQDDLALVYRAFERGIDGDVDVNVARAALEVAPFAQIDDASGDNRCADEASS